MDNNELYHHGILGQKWGRRRYQNADGSYTQAGMNRYNKQKTHKYTLATSESANNNSSGKATSDTIDLSYLTKYPPGSDNSSKKTSSDDTAKTNTTTSKNLTKDDIKRYRKAVDAGSKVVKQLSDFENQRASKKTKKTRMDLSNMSDEEMKSKINREVLERRYNDLFSKTSDDDVSEGHKRVTKLLGAAGGVLAVTGSALSVALAIKELKG